MNSGDPRRVKRPLGFTLIELMVAVIIVGILAAIAYPSYRNYMVQTRRSDAMIALTQLASQQERFFTRCDPAHYAANIGGGTQPACGTGPNFTDSTLGLSTTSPESHYDLAVTIGNIAGPCAGAGTATNITCGFTATATPRATSPQNGNGALRIDATGRREWNRNNAGTWVSWSTK